MLFLAFPLAIGSALKTIDPALNYMFVDGLQEAILIVAVLMFLGLLWNQWAGGASGFLLGSIYALSVSVAYGAWTDISRLGYVVSVMLIGYIAGAVNKGSYSFRRMLISGLTAEIIVSPVLFLPRFLFLKSGNKAPIILLIQTVG